MGQTPPSLDSTKGILHYQKAQEKFRLVRKLPSSPLREFIEFYWLIDWDLTGQEPYMQEVLPFPTSNISVGPDHARLTGIVRGRFLYSLQGQGHILGIKFHPGTIRSIYLRSAHFLTGQKLSLLELFPQASNFVVKARSTLDIDQRVQLAEQFLLGLNPRSSLSLRMAKEVVQYIQTHRDLLRVEAVADHFGLGKRSLQRLFREYVGVSPKWAINRFRLQEAAELAARREGVLDWADLAQELGFFDQAHLIRDFKKLVGATPAAYVRRLRADRSIK